MAALCFSLHSFSPPDLCHYSNLCSKPDFASCFFTSAKREIQFPNRFRNPRNLYPNQFSRVFLVQNSFKHGEINVSPSESPNLQLEISPFEDKNPGIQLPWHSLNPIPQSLGISLESNGSLHVKKQKNFNFSFLGKKLIRDGVKMPTAPWMKGPLLIPADEVLDFSKSEKKSGDKENQEYRSLTEKVRGGRGKHAMRKIIERISKLQKIHQEDEKQKKSDQVLSEKAVLTGTPSSNFSDVVDKREKFSVSLDRVNELDNPRFRVKLPWARAEKIVFPREKKQRTPTAAELRIPDPVLSKLRVDAAKLTKWVKVKKAGLTQAALDEINFTWKRNELAMVKFDIPLCRNMERAREIVETKTRGLVVWSKKDTLVVYRGCNYHQPSKDSPKLCVTTQLKSNASNTDATVATNDRQDPFVVETVVNRTQFSPSMNTRLFEREADRLLNGLGPRFVDWWWPKPLPVDADLLPEVVPGFKPPFRMCPPRMKPKLTDEELMYLRKLARPLPTHFALGKNTRLQGLAAAIIKLWEKSLIAKIAVKWGIPNTNNDQMSWELKRLTGGVLLLRNKFFIILYRGKDFLPRRVADSIAERETHLKNLQAEEETARLKAVKPFSLSDEMLTSRSSVGTIMEFQEIQAKCGLVKIENWETEVLVEAEKERLRKELRKQQRSLLILKSKMERSEKVLSEFNAKWRPAEQEPDCEMITEEEKQTFRKIGQKMDEILLLGRRGIYDGVIGSIHQHWKHREVVKVITMQSSYSHILSTAKLLEIESGGILVSVDKLRRGHAIIIYRGKNYKRPPKLLPENLLTKKAALIRSIEMQRRGSLRFFAYEREKMIWNLKRQLRNLQESSEKLVLDL